MGLFSRITGRPDAPKKEEEPAAAVPSSSAQGNQEEILRDVSPGSGSSYGPPSVSSSAMPNLGTGFNSMNAVPSARLYDPYEGISSAVGGKKQSFNIPDRTEFVFEEEAAGTETLKLKTNRLLNSSGSFARPLGNGAGITGLFFASFESLICNQLEFLDLPAAVHSMLAGACAGALFRSPRGPRQAAAAAAVGLVGGSGIAALRTVIPSL
eukprot:gene23120-30321_t